jgi:cbb3-type cytochrome oxidase cytochrome c subunit
VNGQGTEFGPDLDGTASRHPREWIEAHFRDPAKMSPGSPMPAFHFNESDRADRAVRPFPIQNFPANPSRASTVFPLRSTRK